MFFSWLLGKIGWIVGLLGVITVFAGLYSRGKGGDYTIFFIGLAVIAAASFMKYLSRHTVRVRK